MIAPLQPLPDAGRDGGLTGDAADVSDVLKETSGDGPGEGDGASPAPCDRSARFRAPVMVPGLNRDPGSEQRFTISADELTAYVALGIDWTVSDIFVATRSRREDPFGLFMGLRSINSTGGEDSVSLTGDGLRVFVESNRYSGRGRIWTAIRSAVADQFTQPTQMTLNTNPDDELDPYVLPDGSALYFTGNVPGFSGIFRAALTGSSASPPVPISNTLERFPVVTQDELSIYFVRGPGNPPNPYKIWMATRTSRELPFGEAIELTELNGDDYDSVPAWISADDCRLYSTHTLPGSMAYSYVAERVRN